MKPNIGIINSMVRITAGLSMLTLLTIRANKTKEVHPMLVVLASMKVAEGIVRYCPLTAAFEEMSEETDGIEQGWQQNLNKFSS
ncbi:YgaP family membrane protein [Halobacillus sp. K22]|uniref:YgaP family membrane protein n=1 Tax=Halobacillus sp. K22 TaxID=3457431 RepID=UPI003FCE2D04